MKTLNRIITIIAFVGVSLATISCDENDATKDYGFPYVYIPQATVTGLDNSYPIPGGPFGQNTSYRCYYLDGMLNIALGVVRSGYLSDQKGFSVKLNSSSEVAQVKLDEYASKSIPAMSMPMDVCTIPSTIEVAKGKNSGTTYISVDMKALALQKSSIATPSGYKLLVLGLQISDPSEYQLAEENTSVVVVLDLNDGAWDNVSEISAESEVRDLFPRID